MRRLLLVCLMALAGCGDARKTLVGTWTSSDPRSANRFPQWDFNEDGSLTITRVRTETQTVRYRFRATVGRLIVTAYPQGHELVDSKIRWESNDRVIIEDPGTLFPGRKSILMYRIEPTIAEITQTIEDVDDQKGQSLECAQKLGRIARGLLLYAADHDDRLPPSATWMDASMPYVGDKPSAFRCPTVVAGYGYEFLVTLGGATITAAMQAEDQAMVYDSANLSWNARGKTALAKPRHDKVTVIGTVNGGVRKDPGP